MKDCLIRFLNGADIPLRKVMHNHGGIGEIEFKRLMMKNNFQGPIDFIDYSIIRPGNTIGAHKHFGNEEIYFIIEGSPKVTINDETRELKTGDVAVVHSGDEHELINDSGAQVAILVIQVSSDVR